MHNTQVHWVIWARVTIYLNLFVSEGEKSAITVTWSPSTFSGTSFLSAMPQLRFENCLNFPLFPTMIGPSLRLATSF